MVQSAPFADWLNRRAEELGSGSAVAASAGLSATTVSAYRRGLSPADKQPKNIVGVDVVRRALEHDGTTSFEELYDAVELQEAA